MSIAAAIIGLVVLCALLAPFFVGAGGLLAPAAQINSPERLEALTKALLERYLEDERAHEKGDLSALAWRKRKEFLVSRYVDAVRRLDFVRAGMQAEAASPKAQRAGDAS